MTWSLGRCSSTCWRPGWPNAMTSICTETPRRPAGCCAATRATKACGAGSTRAPGRRGRRGSGPVQETSGAASRDIPWRALSTDWGSCDGPRGSGGAPLYDQPSADMVFRPGPVFTQLLLADEINRTPPKTQAALLEAMGEGQVSVDGESRRLPQPFIVLATDNPIEYEGTYELPEAQLDRFLMRLRLGYLTATDETDMLQRRIDRQREQAQLQPVT